MRTPAVPPPEEKVAAIRTVRKGFMKWAVEDQLAQERKQQLHDQKVQFNAEKHQMAMAAQQSKLQQPQAGAEAQQPQPTMDQLRHGQEQQYRANLMSVNAPPQKTAEYYYDPNWGTPQAMNPAAPTLLGAGMGGAAAHFLLPSKETVRYRDAGKTIGRDVLEQIRKLRDTGKAIPDDLFRNIKDFDDVGGTVMKRLPVDEAKQYLRGRAWQANAGRMAIGLGAGAGVGYLAHKLLNRNRQG